MNYGKIYYCDIANGIGIRTSLFVSGCRHHCKECFNPETWDFSYGKPFDKKTEDTLLSSLKSDYTDGISILGGEPLEPENQEAICSLVKRIKSECQKKTIWIYTGFLYEELNSNDMNIRCVTTYTKEILENTDILVDGEFILERKNISLRFRGSANQRIIDVQKSLKEGRVVLSEYM